MQQIYLVPCYIGPAGPLQCHHFIREPVRHTHTAKQNEEWTPNFREWRPSFAIPSRCTFRSTAPHPTERHHGSTRHSIARRAKLVSKQKSDLSQYMSESSSPITGTEPRRKVSVPMTPGEAAVFFDVVSRFSSPQEGRSPSQLGERSIASMDAQGGPTLENTVGQYRTYVPLGYPHRSYDDEASAKNSLEGAFCCGVRSKGRGYLRKDGMMVKRFVCQYYSMKGWKQCSHSGTIIRRPDGRYEVEVQAGTHAPHERDADSTATRAPPTSVKVLREIDKFVDSNAKPKRIQRALRKRGLLKGIKNPRKCINNRLYQTRNRLNASNSRPPPGASRADITAYCEEKSTIPECPDEAYCIHHSFDPDRGLEIHISTPSLIERYATAEV
ncbi:hypothetical protein FOZ62_003542, partial [Perkinsus olseni]